MKITAGIPTKGRYDTLSHTLLSLALQEKKPYEVIIVDDNESPVDIRTIPLYEHILKLFDTFNIKWKVMFGAKKGQHHSHQLVQDVAEGDYIFRIDDDCVAEHDVLRRLATIDKTNIGAMAPAVMMPNPEKLPFGLRNRIRSMNAPNVQWFLGSGLTDADHLYSCFLYKKGIANYDLNLSTVAHREETIFSHSIKRAGWDLLVNSDAKVWHFRQPQGGIRTFQNHPELWEHDEKIFNGYLNFWGVNNTDTKVVVLDSGLGDHYAFKNILPRLRQKYSKIKIACCYPQVFFDEEGLELISIAEAKLLYGNIDNYGIYKFMIDNNWADTLENAYLKLYL